MQKLSMLPNPHPHKQIHHLSINDEKRCYNYVEANVFAKAKKWSFGNQGQEQDHAEFPF